MAARKNVDLTWKEIPHPFDVLARAPRLPPVHWHQHGCAARLSCPHGLVGVHRVVAVARKERHVAPDRGHRVQVVGVPSVVIGDPVQREDITQPPVL